MKISLRTLFIVVALVGVITAALVQPSLLWMRIMFTLSIGFLAYAIAGSLAARGQARSFWIGAAVFGGGYGVMLMEGPPQVRFNPSVTSMLSRALITQPLLDVLAEARGLQVRSHFGDFKLWDESIYHPNVNAPNGVGGGPAAPPGGGGVFDVEPEGLNEPTAGGSAVSPAAPPGSGASGSAAPASTGSGFTGGMPPAAGTPGGPPGMGSGMMPAAVPIATRWTQGSYNHFLITGHCAFLILFGLAGGTLCRWTFGRGEAGQVSC